MELDDRFRRIGTYKVLSTIAISGKSELYKCLDPSVNRYVAIKILAGEWARDTIVSEHFETAARAAQRIEHRNVARLFAVERTEDFVPYLVMEYVEGPSLADFIKNKVELPYGRIADIFIQAADGLQAAYHENVLHCDIKPSNLMLNARDEVKIIDFGIARTFREAVGRHRLTRTVVGTPKYMSPEQCLGKTIDHRADIYSLGATMYHILTGQAPYDCETLSEIIAKHASFPIAPIYIINPKVPTELTEIVHAMLAKEPDERYQTYDRLIEDLKRFQLSRVSKEGVVVESGEGSSTLQLQEEDIPLGATSRGAVAYPKPVARLGEEPEAVPRPRVVPPLELEKPSRLRSLAIMVGVFLVLLGGLTIVFRQVGPGSEEKRSGARFLSSLIHAIFKPKTPEQKMTREQLFVARCKETMARMRELRDMVRGYIADKGKIPESLQEVVDAGYLTEEGTRDAWGRPIVYIRMDSDLRSFGEDGEEDTTDDIRLNANGQFYYVPPAYMQRQAETP